LGASIIATEEKTVNRIGKVKQGFAILFFIVTLSNCQSLSPSSQTSPVTPITINTLDVVIFTPTLSSNYQPTSTPITSTPILEEISTATPIPTFDILPTLPNPPTRDPKILLPSNLLLDEWELTKGSTLDRISFAPVLGTREQILEKYQKLYFDIFPSPLIQGYNRMMLHERELIVNEKIADSKSTIHVFYDGTEITQIDAGYNFPPTTNIWGLWTYENHWILEYVSIFHDPYGNSYKLGNIIWDGESLNTKFDYQESFGLTAINGRIFYFFRRNDRFGIAYNGTEYDTNYESIVHYQRRCAECKDYENPQELGDGYQLNQNLSFFAERNENQYFVVISAR
jgi:hypothetical protein